jgi:hypothetical protein
MLVENKNLWKEFTKGYKNAVSDPVFDRIIVQAALAGSTEAARILKE